MLTSKSTQRVEIPGEPEEWAVIKPLSFAERTEAEKVYTDHQMETIARLSAETIKMFHERLAEAERDTPQAVRAAEEAVAATEEADLLASVDTRTVLLHGLKRLSYDEGTDVTPQVVDDLDPETYVALAKLIMGLSRRTVEEGKGSSPTLPSSSEG